VSRRADASSDFVTWTSLVPSARLGVLSGPRLTSIVVCVETVKQHRSWGARATEAWAPEPIARALALVDERADRQL